MEVDSLLLVIDWAVSPECKSRRVGPPTMSLKVHDIGN
jgi:hypothetical protein